ncbi:MAG: hypothetical protein WA871_15650 [Candidatus Acidiferrales bacterium]
MATRSKSTPRNPESGYTLLIALLIVATILLITAAAAPNIYVEGRRDRDEEMIWRGQQYTRAIGLYYRKYGHYPHTIDDLVKSDNQIRFLRQAYKDPMNTDDGSWRLIYVGPGGVLINSVMYTNIAQVGLPVSGAPAPGGANGDQGSSFGTPTASGAPPTGPGAAPSNSTDDDSGPTPLMGDVVGGNLVGVGSKVKKPSIKVYNGGATYYQWEFIWKPLQAQQAGAPVGAQSPEASGTAASPTGTPAAPATSPAPEAGPSASPSPSPGP